jgi:hypothetical protein
MADALTSRDYATETHGLVLHQALHGYSDGHRLLESSTPVPDDLKRLMQRMSDLSGTSIANGFQHYLTGYPLFSLDAYALAETWYAPEMSRPGCVWTHTLIIPASAMARIASLGSLRQLFRRPSGRSIGDAYSKPLVLEFGLSAREYEPNMDHRSKMPAFLSSHYRKDWHPVIIPAVGSHEYAEMILAAWSQKWPALRMSFTFCTGSLSSRTFENRSMDVQCVPISAIRQVSREIVEGGSDEPILLDFAADSSPPWAIAAGDDALQPSGGPLRSFLWSVADTDSTRADFKSYVKIYNLFDEQLPLSAMLELTAQLFPHPANGRRLKKATLGSQGKLAVPGFKSEEILLGLATTDHSASFDLEELSVRERATRMMAQDPTAGCVLLGELFRASLNPIGDEILKALILAMRPEDAFLFAVDQQQFLPALFCVNSALATSQQLWQVGKDRKRELFESLTAQQDIPLQVIRGIVNALLDSNSDAFIGQAFAKWENVAVFAALDWVQAHNGSMTEPCRAALTSNIDDVMSWIGAGPDKSTSTLSAVAHVVAPYSSRIAHHSSTVWLRTLRALHQNHQEEEEHYVSAFVLALALCNAPPAPLDLVSESFERVHWLAEKERLRDEAWLILEPLVPELSWGKNWDKCERLRRALMRAFVRYSWPARQLSERIRDRNLTEQLLKSARKVDADRYFRNV